MPDTPRPDAPAVTLAEQREAVESVVESQRVIVRLGGPGRSREEATLDLARLEAVVATLRDVEAFPALWESDADAWEADGRPGWQYVASTRRECAQMIRRLSERADPS